ncbi:MAG: hypothetical protein CENE_02201 [Candidatus Celerinatantimonas neptuna]|nr:MAG: hypothetical protein CENE_02201 [Candidatus Celerinatantimonas neptuna]
MMEATTHLAERLCKHYPQALPALENIKAQYPHRPQRWLLQLIAQKQLDADEVSLYAQQLAAKPPLTQPHDDSNLPAKLQLDHLLDRQVIVTSCYAGVIQIGVIDPTDDLLIDEFRELCQQDVELQILHPLWLKQQLDKIAQSIPASHAQLSRHDETHLSLSKQIYQIIDKAWTDGASDLHFEPMEQEYRLRARFDGLLQHYLTLPLSQAPRISSWLKMNANLDIAQKRIPQDGQLSLSPDRLIHADIRISTLPTIYGEKIVLRFLGTHRHSPTLAQLGFTEKQLAILHRALSQPQGMIIVTGPTGAGKTRTLYAALDQINHPTLNISTAEDPVEISLSGINQVAVNPPAGLTFACLLRAFLRQDPDVIMVGEIRDSETLNMAFHASLTGHLVLTTLHTNNALKTLTRLNQLGITPYQISESVQLIVAQRLVRKLCPKCRQLNSSSSEPYYLPIGCSHCHNGFKGRIGIFELLPITNTIGKLIETQSNIHLQNEITQHSHCNFKEHASYLIRNGITSKDEIARVLGYEYIN